MIVLVAATSFCPRKEIKANEKELHLYCLFRKPKTSMIFKAFCFLFSSTIKWIFNSKMWQINEQFCFFSVSTVTSAFLCNQTFHYVSQLQSNTIRCICDSLEAVFVEIYYIYSGGDIYVSKCCFTLIVFSIFVDGFPCICFRCQRKVNVFSAIKLICH